MFFKQKTTRFILGFNLVVAAIIYLNAASRPDVQSVLEAGFFTLMQMAANLVLALFLAFLSAIAAFRSSELNRTTLAFLLSVGLVLLVSFPTCYLLSLVKS